MCFRSVCNYCPNLDQVPTVILDQVPQKELYQSNVDRKVCILSPNNPNPLYGQPLDLAGHKD